jgi:hypothetical protein
MINQAQVGGREQRPHPKENAKTPLSISLERMELEGSWEGL